MITAKLTLMVPPPERSFNGENEPSWGQTWWALIKVATRDNEYNDEMMMMMIMMMKTSYMRTNLARFGKDGDKDDNNTGRDATEIKIFKMFHRLLLNSLHCNFILLSKTTLFQYNHHHLHPHHHHPHHQTQALVWWRRGVGGKKRGRSAGAGSGGAASPPSKLCHTRIFIISVESSPSSSLALQYCVMDPIVQHCVSPLPHMTICAGARSVMLRYIVLYYVLHPSMG